jgi:hypothetical protein
MTVLDMILNHDPQVRLLWEMRCDCTERNPLIGAVYAHEEDRHLFLPSFKGRHAATGVTVRRASRARPLASGVVVAEITECSRCRSFFALTSAPISSAYLAMAIRLGAPDDNPFMAGEHVTMLQVPFDASAVQVVPGLFLTPFGKPTHTQVAPG